MLYPTPTTKNADYRYVYEPAEDSFLLLDTLEAERDFLCAAYDYPSVVEVGTGSGIITAFLQQNILPDALYFTIDISAAACKCSLLVSSENGGSKFMDSVQADILTPLRDGAVDVLVFNPPYVPSEKVPTLPLEAIDDKWLDLALEGGQQGMETTWRLLDMLDSKLSRKGVAYVLLCASNLPEQVACKMSAEGWNVEKVASRRAGWEVLGVWKFSR